MFCKYCGNKLTDDAKFCTNCGAKNEDYQESPKQEEQAISPITQLPETSQEETENKESAAIEKIFASTETNATTTSNSVQNPNKKYCGLAIAGFVLSLVGILVAGIPCGILGIIFSSIAFKEIKTKNLKGKGLAIAGLVISIIDIVLVLISFGY